MAVDENGKLIEELTSGNRPYVAVNKDNNTRRAQILDENGDPMFTDANPGRTQLTGSNVLKTGIINVVADTTNLYTGANNTSGYFVSWTTGSLQANASYTASDYIPVEPDRSYEQSFETHMAIYDENKDFIEGHQQGDGYKIFSTPSNAAYVRVSAKDLTGYTLTKIPMVQLPNIQSREVMIIAKKSNTDSVYVGGEKIVSSVNYGVELSPGDSINYNVDNANLIFISPKVSGEGVSYNAIK